MAFTWGNIERGFRDPALHAEFQREGFVTVPFLTPGQLAKLQQVYQKFHPEKVEGFHTTTFNPDSEYRRAVHAGILAEVKGSINMLFEAYKIYFCSFISKAPGPKSELILHQDMSLVDESRFNGINIWCPLVDLTQENGALHVLPRSHRIFPTYRGASLPDIYDGVEREVRHYMEPMFLAAGTAVIFDQSIMHYSPPNLSGEIRPVINTFVAHENSKIVVAYANQKKHPGKVELIDQTDDFMFENQQFGTDIFAPPEIGKSAGRVAYDFPQASAAQLAERYGPLPEGFYDDVVPDPTSAAASPSRLSRFLQRFQRKS